MKKWKTNPIIAVGCETTNFVQGSTHIYHISGQEVRNNYINESNQPKLSSMQINIIFCLNIMLK